MEWEADPDNADRDPARERERAYRRRQHQRPNEGMRMTKPPHRAKLSSSRRKVNSANYKRNLRLRGIRTAALKFLRGRNAQELPIMAGNAGALAPTISMDTKALPNTNDDYDVISKGHKRKRRGGKAAKRSRQASEQMRQACVPASPKSLPQPPRFLAPQPKWTARPTR